MRIIAGSARGRKLATPPRHKGLRPTGDRVREAIFGILSSRWELAGVEVLDLFAGTGALGCEALSRGARSVVFVEQSASTARLIRENLRRIGQPDQQIVCGEVIDALAGFRARRFDIVFLDPPYADHKVAQIVLALDRSEVLCHGATVVAEHGRDEPLPPPEALGALKHQTTRTYGDTCVTLWELPEEESP